MKNKEISKQLEEIAEVLKPLTHAISHNTMMWDGVRYVKYEGEEKKPNPYALSWWFALTMLAAFIKSQEFPLTFKQIDCIRNFLFGTMGGVTDLFFDPQSVGEVANSINARLDTKRKILLKELNDMCNAKNLYRI